MMHYILDACALLIIFNGEPGAQKVLDLLDQAEKAGEFSILWLK
jgi:PIN domain nuclease of toxin-antitoxin system